jgi:hypothetical protein
MGLFVASRIADLQDIELNLMPMDAGGGAVFRVGFKQAAAAEAVEPAPTAVAV